ncbi:helix-turn-helix domain-containing protein [Cryobacterium sp. SO1]|uniref:winged helix-turn-helix transcriptional regulator n=1 Tax=Cryobacterium sp. SO1 TaxID=1897061 RepID=UPI0010ECCCE5|nr:HTH-type transcriptional activator HxlR [Cryobacterium sp. SO1]
MVDTSSYTAHGDGSVPFAADCPSRPILDQIADKWSMMALAVLEKPTRFNEIKRQLSGVTQRVLTQTLRRLERNGMITRRVIPTSPIGVEYALTPPSANRCANHSGGSMTGQLSTPRPSGRPKLTTTQNPDQHSVTAQPDAERILCGTRTGPVER